MFPEPELINEPADDEQPEQTSHVIGQLEEKATLLDPLEKPKKKNEEANHRRRLLLSLLLGGITAAAYGLVTRVLIGGIWYNGAFQAASFFSTMTSSFLGLMPLGLGALTVFFTPRGFRASYNYTVSASFLTALVFLIVTSITAIEATICLCMAAPLVFGMSALGAVLMCWTLRQIDKLRMGVKTKNYLILILLAAPYLINPFESQVPPQDSIRRVDNQITINASPQAVWQNIIRVPAIAPQELQFSISHLMGVPLPVEATLSQEGVGGVRHASFDDGLMFIEAITDWQDLKMIRFTIKVDTQSVREAPFDQIGGAAFDVLDGSYLLEPVGNRVILHLSSHERLTTRFNGYGGFWTDLIMSDLQNNILQVIKQRAEVGMQP